MKELRGHEEAVLCVKTLRKGDRIVSGDRLGYLRVWCTTTGACLGTFKRHMMGVSCLAVQGDLLVTGSWVKLHPIVAFSFAAILRILYSPPFSGCDVALDIGQHRHSVARHPGLPILEAAQDC